jgi:hypothetical protein
MTADRHLGDDPEQLPAPPLLREELSATCQSTQLLPKWIGSQRLFEKPLGNGVFLLRAGGKLLLSSSLPPLYRNGVTRLY